MNTSQRQEAAYLAKDLLGSGYKPTDLVYIRYLSDTNAESETSIAGLSDPITQEEYTAAKTPVVYTPLGTLISHQAPLVSLRAN